MRWCPDDFSVRWQGEIESELSQLYTFTANSANQLRLWIGGQLVIDDWKAHSNHERGGSIALEAGKRYPLTLEYLANTGSAVVRPAFVTLQSPRQWNVLSTQRSSVIEKELHLPPRMR